MPLTADRFKRFVITHVWILPILLAALWLRMAGLGNEHLYGDEAEYAIVARYLSRDMTYLAYPDITGMGATPFVSQPPLILYTMAISMKLFGATDFAALLPSILFGAATVVAIYALGHRLGGKFLGLGAAAVLAVLPFHVEMSRRAMLDAGYVFFLVLTAYFCVAWLQDRRWQQALGVGIGVACAALSKLPGVLAGPIALAVFALGLVIAIARRDKALVKKTALHGAIGAAPVAIGAFLYLALLSSINSLGNLWMKLEWQMGRVDTSRAVAQEATAVYRPPTWYFTDPNMGLADNLMPLVFALAVVGLLAVLVRFAFKSTRGPEHVVAPLFVVALMTFFMWSDRKEGFYMLPIAPFAALFVAYAGDSFRRMLAWAGLKFRPTSARPVAIGALALGIVIVAWPANVAASETVDDFVYGNDQEKYFGYGTRDAAEFIEARDPGAGQYGTLLGRFSLHWYNEQDTYHWYIDHTYIESKIQSGELKYIVYEDYLGLAFDREYMRQLIQKYHGESVTTFRKEWGEVTVFELHPAG